MHVTEPQVQSTKEGQSQFVHQTRPQSAPKARYTGATTHESADGSTDGKGLNTRRTQLRKEKFKRQRFEKRVQCICSSLQHETYQGLRWARKSGDRVELIASNRKRHFQGIDKSSHGINCVATKPAISICLPNSCHSCKRTRDSQSHVASLPRLGALSGIKRPKRFSQNCSAPLKTRHAPSFLSTAVILSCFAFLLVCALLVCDCRLTCSSWLTLFLLRSVVSTAAAKMPSGRRSATAPSSALSAAACTARWACI
jgi:hypothetical protein